MGLLDRIASKPPLSAPPESIDVNERHELEIAWHGGPRAGILP